MIDYKLLAVDAEGIMYAINGLVVTKMDKPDAFYGQDTSFFKAACPAGTEHNAEIFSGGLVNLY